MYVMYIHVCVPYWTFLLSAQKASWWGPLLLVLLVEVEISLQIQKNRDNVYRYVVY